MKTQKIIFFVGMMIFLNLHSAEQAPEPEQTAVAGGVSVQGEVKTPTPAVVEKLEEGASTKKYELEDLTLKDVSPIEEFDSVVTYAKNVYYLLIDSLQEEIRLSLEPLFSDVTHLKTLYRELQFARDGYELFLGFGKDYEEFNKSYSDDRTNKTEYIQNTYAEYQNELDPKMVQEIKLGNLTPEEIYLKMRLCFKRRLEIFNENCRYGKVEYTDEDELKRFIYLNLKAKRDGIVAKRDKLIKDITTLSSQIANLRNWAIDVELVVFKYDLMKYWRDELVKNLEAYKTKLFKLRFASTIEGEISFLNLTSFDNRPDQDNVFTSIFNHYFPQGKIGKEQIVTPSGPASTVEEKEKPEAVKPESPEAKYDLQNFLQKTAYSSLKIKEFWAPIFGENKGTSYDSLFIHNYLTALYFDVQDMAEAVKVKAAAKEKVLKNLDMLDYVLSGANKKIVTEFIKSKLSQTVEQ